MRTGRRPTVVLVGPAAADVVGAVPDDCAVTTVGDAGGVTAEDLEEATAVVVTGVDGVAAVLDSARDADPELPVVAATPTAAVPVDRVAADRAADVVPPATDTDDRGLLTSRLRSAVAARQRARDLKLVERAFDDAPVGITISDPDRPDNPLVYVNAGFERQTGYDARFAVGRNCRFLQGPDTDEETVAEIRAAVDEARPVDVEILNYREDGTPFWNHLIVRPLFDEDGDLEYFVGYQQGVTDRVEARRDAERRSEDLAALASVLSHDIRNPLNVAMGHAEALRGGDTDPTETAGTVVEALARIEEILSDAVVLVRGDVDALEPVTLSAVAADAWDAVETSGAAMTVDGDLRLRADRSLLAQLLENLFANAVEHGSTSNRPEAGDPVEQGATNDAGVAATVESLANGFAVADDGPGVPPDERERVFDLGVTTRPDGTGLGLGIVARVADAHGWEVRMDEGGSGGARVVVTGVERLEEER